MFHEAQVLLGGDQACASLITNPGFLKTYASDPPCKFE
jgi:hypothetical protein